MPDSQRFPWNLCPIKFELDINENILWKLIIFNYFFSLETWLFPAWKYIRVIKILPRITTISSTLLIIYRFQGYRSESCIAIFALRVTLNHAYSPFKPCIILTLSLSLYSVNLESVIQCKLMILSCTGPSTSNWWSYHFSCL